MSSKIIYSFICPHCGQEILPPEGKSLIMRDIQEMRDYQNKKKYWKNTREKKKIKAMEEYLERVRHD